MIPILFFISVGLGQNFYDVLATPVPSWTTNFVAGANMLAALAHVVSGRRTS